MLVILNKRNRNKRVFCHIPKTGGGYILNCIEKAPDLEILWNSAEELGNNHISYSDLPEKYSDLKSFAILREPIDWYQSFYRWFGEREWKKLLRFNNFNSFIENSAPVDSLYLDKEDKLFKEDYKYFYFKYVIGKNLGLYSIFVKNCTKENNTKFYSFPNTSFREEIIDILISEELLDPEDSEYFKSVKRTNFSRKSIQTNWTDELLDKIKKVDKPLFDLYENISNHSSED